MRGSVMRRMQAAKRCAAARAGRRVRRQQMRALTGRRERARLRVVLGVAALLRDDAQVQLVHAQVRRGDDVLQLRHDARRVLRHIDGGGDAASCGRNERRRGCRHRRERAGRAGRGTGRAGARTHLCCRAGGSRSPLLPPARTRPAHAGHVSRRRRCLQRARRPSALVRCRRRGREHATAPAPLRRSPSADAAAAESAAGSERVGLGGALLAARRGARSRRGLPREKRAGKASPGARTRTPRQQLRAQSTAGSHVSGAAAAPSRAWARRCRHGDDGGGYGALRRGRRRVCFCAVRRAARAAERRACFLRRPARAD